MLSIWTSGKGGILEKKEGRKTLALAGGKKRRGEGAFVSRFSGAGAFGKEEGKALSQKKKKAKAIEGGEFASGTPG